MKKLFTLFTALLCVFTIYAQVTGSGNGFKETFDYGDGTVFADVTYEDGIFVEWPESSSVLDGVLTWDTDIDGEGSFGAEFDVSMDLTGDANLTFKYKFPTDAFVDIYLVDSDGLESELSVTFAGGVDELQELTLDLTAATGIEGGDPADLSILAGFFIIYYTPTASTLSLDDVLLGDAEIIITNPITESGNGFEEPFDYSDGIVFDDVTYEGAFVEWPEISSVQGGILSWDTEIDGEGSFGAEFMESMSLSENATLNFEYKFPVDAFVDIYLVDSDGLESELSVTFIGGTDELQEISLNLGNATGIEGGDPADLSILMGFYIIYYTPTASTLSLDDVKLGDATVGIGNHEMQNHFRIYPNPASTDVRIDMDAEKVSIFNTAGQVVYRESNYRMGSSINVSELNGGMYIIKADEHMQKLIIR